MHRNDICMGDVNEQNILISKGDDEIYFVDTDSYQFDGHICPVGQEAYASPEYIRANTRDGELCYDGAKSRRDEQFAMAVMFYRILFLGAFPFRMENGHFVDAICNQDFRFFTGDVEEGENGPEQLREDLIWNGTPERIREMFVKSFRTSARFKPEEWMEALDMAMEELASGLYSKELVPGYERYRQGMTATQQPEKAALRQPPLKNFGAGMRQPPLKAGAQENAQSRQVKQQVQQPVQQPSQPKVVMPKPDVKPEPKPIGPKAAEPTREPVLSVPKFADPRPAEKAVEAKVEEPKPVGPKAAEKSATPKQEAKPTQQPVQPMPKQEAKPAPKNREKKVREKKPVERKELPMAAQVVVNIVCLLISDAVFMIESGGWVAVFANQASTFGMASIACVEITFFVIVGMIIAVRKKRLLGVIRAFPLILTILMSALAIARVLIY